MNKLKREIILLLIILMTMSVLGESIPRTIAYQGKITNDEGVGVNDTLPVVFHLFSTSTGGTALWTETHPDVPIVKGLFDVRLGSLTPLNLPFDNAYYLQLTVDGHVMLPRIPFGMSPYSFRAIYADTALYAIYADSSASGGGFLQSDIDVPLTSPGDFFVITGETEVHGALRDLDGAVNLNRTRIANNETAIAVHVDADHDLSPFNECVTHVWFDSLTQMIYVFDGGWPVGARIPVYSDDLSDNVIGDLLDVTVDTVYNGQVLVWEDSMWVPAYLTIPESLYIWNQDSMMQQGDIRIDGVLEVGDIIGQGDARSLVSGVYDIDIAGSEVVLTDLSYNTYGSGSTVFLTFDGVFDDSNGLLGAYFAVEIVRNPGPGEVVVGETQIHIFSENFYRATPVTLNAIDHPPAGVIDYEVRARCIGEPYTGGKCIGGKLILSEIKN